MTKTTDLIDQISQVRARRQFGHALAELPFRLHEIERSFRSVDRAHKELVRYFPVVLVATLEGYFRMLIAELIDDGDPYLQRAEEANTRDKFDFVVLRALRGKKLTVGELYAHTLPFSSLAHIQSSMTTLIGTSFFSEVAAVHDRWAVEVQGLPSKPILADAQKVFSAVSRTFELRHIICHEIPSALEFDIDEIGDCIEKCVAFLRATDEYVSELRKPGYPLTQSAMNDFAGSALTVAQDAMAVALLDRRSKLAAGSEAESALDAAQKAWAQYADDWCHFAVGPRSESGSIWPVVYFGAMEELVKKRTEELQNFKPFGDGL